MDDPTDKFKAAALRADELARIVRDLDMSAISKLPALVEPAYKQLINSGSLTEQALRLAEAYQANSFHDDIVRRMAAWTEEYQRLTEPLKGLGALALDENSTLRAQALGIASTFPRLDASKFIGMTDMSVLQRAADAAARIVLAPDVYTDQLRWRDELRDRMSGISSTWMFVEGQDFSGYAFANLARFADELQTLSPFSENINELVLDELGAPSATPDDEEPEDREDRFTTAGRDPTLVAFPASSYPDVIVAAGFSIVVPPLPIPIATEQADDSVHFDPFHNQMLTACETYLRQFVHAQLTAAYGPHWIKQRVHGDTVKRWKERLETARTRGRPIYDLLHYTDFGDLAEIIMRGDHWKDIFGAVFQSKEGFRVSMERLHNLRVDLAHSRPLGATDVLTLVTEAPRVLTAIGVNVQTNIVRVAKA